MCICAELPKLAVRTRVVVMMHRREALTSSNTGRLAARVLEGASVRVRGALGTTHEPLPAGRLLALFPMQGARVLSREDAAGDPPVLLVPDGTWSQARKLLQRDADLRDAEIVTLPPGPSTRYGLRRNAREGTLCTLEAIARALAILEGEEIEARLEGVLDLFVGRSRAVRSGIQVPPAGTTS